MSFKDFASVDVALKKYDLTLQRVEIVDLDAITPIRLDPVVWQLLKFDLHHLPANVSEHALCETLIYPLLRAAWQRHPRLHVWSHPVLQVNEELSGVPDYVIAPESPKGLSEVITPLLAVVETKRDDFVQGWGQCVAAMLAAQKLNQGITPTPTIYGVVTSGKTWEFGKLAGSMVTIHPFNLAITQADVVVGVLDHIFTACERQLDAAEL
jgi:hypothetical protein